MRKVTFGRFVSEFGRMYTIPFTGCCGSGAMGTMTVTLNVCTVTVIVCCADREGCVPNGRFNATEFRGPGRIGGVLTSGSRGFGQVLDRGIGVSLSFEELGLGKGVLVYNNSKTKGAFCRMGPGLVRVPRGYSFVYASPGKRVLEDYNRVLGGGKCGIGIVGLLRVSGSSYCGPFSCVERRASIIGLVAGLVDGAAPGKTAPDSPF